MDILIEFKKRILEEFRSRFKEAIEFMKRNYSLILSLEKDAPKFDPYSLEGFNLLGERPRGFSTYHKNEDSFSLPQRSGRGFPQGDADQFSDQELSQNELQDDTKYKVLQVSDFCVNSKYSFVYFDDNARRRGQNKNQHQEHQSSIAFPEVKIDLNEPQEILNKRLTHIKKYQSAELSEVSLFMVGYGNIIAKLGNGEDLVFYENQMEPDQYVTEIVKMAEYIVLFKSSFHLLVTDMNLKVQFEAEITEWFEPDDRICCCLVYEDQNLIILGTEMGYLISLVIGFTDRSIDLQSREAFSVKSTKNLFWTYYKNMEFCAAFEDGKVVLLRVTSELVFEPLKVFNYDMDLSYATIFNRLGVIGFRKGVVSIINLDQGTILYSYSLPSEDNPPDKITWIGFLSSESNKKSNRSRPEDISSEQGFIEILSKVRLMVRTERESLYIFNHSLSDNKYQYVQLFENHLKPASGDSSIQLVEPAFEKFDQGITVRFFKSCSSKSELSSRNQPKPEKFYCLMQELHVSLSEDY